MTINQRDEAHDPDRAQDLIFSLQQAGVIDSTQRHLYDGDRYEAGYNSDSVASGSTIELLIQNPSDSGVYLVATRFLTQADSSAEFVGIKNVTVETAGTSLTPINLSTSGGENSNATAQHSPSFSGGTAFPTEIGGSGKASGFSAAGPNILVAPGDNLLAQATNTSSDASVMAIISSWSELNESEVDAVL